MSLKPWYKVVVPREDLRTGEPLDAAEFAVPLEKVRVGAAPSVYQEPEKFFARTYLTNGLTDLAAEVVRRLSGIKVKASAVFNMTTQFGGGKTHALTLLYHLAQAGPSGDKWPGVQNILNRAEINTLPKAAVAVFVGTSFDSLSGRGGSDGTPLRTTPWGEIAYQLGGPAALALVQKHDEQKIAPGGDVIQTFLPKDRPVLILFDEVMSYISRNRKSGLSGQFYNFLQNLSEEARSSENVVLAVSIPASELEMTVEDQADYNRFKKMLDRLGKAVILSVEADTSEIIRRRLFEWGGVPNEAKEAIREYANWLANHNKQLPISFTSESAYELLESTYPFHPALPSVFERKWQSLPRFQQTRGVLRLLAIWVSKVYAAGYKGAHKDPLIGMGTAPLDDPIFRAALFEQLGETKLDAAVTTDIVGKKDAHALLLDKEAVDTIKNSRLHQKIATAVFFESNGGQTNTDATLPEIRLAVSEPGLDIGNVETCLESLTDACYYLRVEKNRYRFGFTPNLNKMLADRRAGIKIPAIEDRIKEEIKNVFPPVAGVERIFFPEKSNQIPDKVVLTFVVLGPQQTVDDEQTLRLIDDFTKNCGSSARTRKSALIWSIPDNAARLLDDARKLLAWEDIADQEIGHLDESQKRQLSESQTKARRDLRESVWRTYKNLMLLGKDGGWQKIDLGLVHSSSADSMTAFILKSLRQDSTVEDGISPNFLVRNWPPAFTEWSTKSIRDAFFSTPIFPRLTSPEAIRDTVARGVQSELFGYVGKAPDGGYSPFYFGDSLTSLDVEISEDMYVIQKEVALEYRASGSMPTKETAPEHIPGDVQTGDTESEGGTAPAGAIAEKIASLSWQGEVPAQKWMNFYTKILARFATTPGLKVTLKIDIEPNDGVSKQQLEETKANLRELGLDDDVETE